jgi:hypothetical protein
MHGTLEQGTNTHGMQTTPRRARSSQREADPPPQTKTKRFTKRTVENARFYAKLFIFTALVFVATETLAQAVRLSLEALLPETQYARLISYWVIGLVFVLIVAIYASFSFRGSTTFDPFPSGGGGGAAASTPKSTRSTSSSSIRIRPASPQLPPPSILHHHDEFGGGDFDDDDADDIL